MGTRMSFDLSGGQIVLLLLNGLLLLLAFFIRQWMVRMQKDVDAANKKASDLVTELHNHQLQCARDFAQKSELSNGRSEMLEAMHKIESKVDRIFDKLDTKADKP